MAALQKYGTVIELKPEQLVRHAADLVLRRVRRGHELAQDLLLQVVEGLADQLGPLGQERLELVGLGQVDEGEDGAVEVGEVPPEDVGLFGTEVLGDVHAHGRGAYGSPHVCSRTPAGRWLLIHQSPRTLLMH